MSMHAAPSAKKVKPKPLREVLSRILQQLQRRDQYLFFAQPVSKVEVPDYYDVIKEPMDLGTMQSKLDSNAYTTLVSFQADLLRLTQNAQLFNSIHGPSAIIHTEAKKLEEWGLKALAKEAPAVEEAIAQAAAEAAEAEAKRRREEEESKRLAAAAASPAPRGRLNIKIRKSSSHITSGHGTPRPMTPSHLQYEITAKKGDSTSQGSDAEDVDSDEEDDSSDDDDDDDEESDDDGDDDDDDDDNDDDDDDEDNESTTDRAASASVDGTHQRRSRNASSFVKKKRKSGGPRRSSRRKKQPKNTSSVVTLLSQSGRDGRPSIAPVSSTSGAVADFIPLKYRPDGAIDLDAFNEDERRTIMRPMGSDAWPDVLMPFLHSIVSLHPDQFLNASTIKRDIKQVADGFGAAIAPLSQSSISSYSFDLHDLDGEHRRLPVLIPSGWAFEDGGPRVPVAWPGLEQSSTSAEREEEREQQRKKEKEKEMNEEGGQVSNVRAPRKDREREREEDGMANLEDWTWPRPYLSRLPEASDFGLYSGLLPQVWVNHIQSQKGGPARSRLPPFHLASGTAFENALLEELTSFPHRALLGGKPGVISMSALHPNTSHPDVTVAMEQAAARNWTPHADELKKLGARGCDVIRETVYGGPIGEAYASSLEEFVRGATDQAMENYVDDMDAEEEEERIKKEENDALPFALMAPLTSNKAPSAYFDENGEMYDEDAYIGVDLVPLEVRKEAGVSSFASNVPSLRQSPQVSGSPLLRKRSRSISASVPPPNKRFARGESRSMQYKYDGDDKDDVGAADSGSIWNDEETAAFMRGTTLDQSLMEHVRDTYLAPLTDGHFTTLLEISRQVKGGKNTVQESSHEAFMSQLAELPSELLVKSEDEDSSMLDVISAAVPIVQTSEESIGHPRIGRLIHLFLQQEYAKAKLQMHELIRAQGNAVNLNMIARNEEDVRYALQLEKSYKPLPRTLLPNPLLDIDDGLRRYADALQLVNETEPGEERSMLIEHLRIIYIALGRQVPKLHQVAGRWTAWLTAARATLAKRAELEEAKRRELLAGSSSATTASEPPSSATAVNNSSAPQE